MVLWLKSGNSVIIVLVKRRTNIKHTRTHNSMHALAMKIEPNNGRIGIILGSVWGRTGATSERSKGKRECDRREGWRIIHTSGTVRQSG